MKYIVLLRGINISGKNKISMEELKKYLIENEYQSVYTYLNSGNIILESNESNKENIVKTIHSLIKENFDLEIPVFVISYLELEDLLNNAPSWWGTGNKQIYDNIIFILSPVQSTEVKNVLGNLNENVEQIYEYKNCFFWSYELKNYRKSNWWVKTSSTYIKDSITIRTANTVKKLLEICKK